MLKRLLLLAMVFAHWQMASSVFAGTGELVTLPKKTPATGTGTGLRIKIDTTWVDSPGYHPVRITVTTADGKPSPDDRVLEMDLLRYQESYRASRRTGVRVTQGVTLAEGETTTSFIMRTPQTDMWEAALFETREYGEVLKQLSLTKPFSINHSGREASRAMLFIRRRDQASLARDPKVDGLIYHFDNAEERGYYGNASVPPGSRVNPGVINEGFFRQSVQAIDNVVIKSPEQLPPKWIDYSCLDLIVVSWDDLKGLSSSRPEVAAAIRQWTFSGGVLCVTDVSNKRDGHPGLSRFLRVPAKEVRTSILGTEYGVGTYYVFDPTASVFETEVRTDDFLSRVTSWPERHEYSGRNYWWNNSYYRDYSAYVIPGVGTVPVNAFRVLITLFVIVIGPVNFYLLRRWRRNVWMFATIPAGALIVTFALVSYATFSDGFAARMRARSLTTIDQRTQATTCWSRQVYYAGIAPTTGFDFDVDTMVIPLNESPRSLKRVFWRGEQQNLRTGYFRSREMTQLLVNRCRKTEWGLSFAKAPESDGTLAIENRLGTAIQQLLVCDHDGKMYIAENVASGASFQSTPVQKPILFWHAPWKDNEQLRMRLASELNEVSNAESALIGQLSKFLAIQGKYLEPGNYVAIVDTSPEMPVGLADAPEESSFHVVRGKW